MSDLTHSHIHFTFLLASTFTFTRSIYSECRDLKMQAVKKIHLTSFYAKCHKCQIKELFMAKSEKEISDSVSYGRPGRQFLSVSNTNFGLSMQVGISEACYIHRLCFPNLPMERVVTNLGVILQNKR